MFEFGNLKITFEYVEVEKYKLDLYDLRQISSNADYLFRDKLMEKLITNFVEVYGGLEAMLGLIEMSETQNTKPSIVKARTLLKKVLKNFKVIIFDTLKAGNIKEYLYVQYLMRFAFLNTISFAFLIKELYAINHSNSKFLLILTIQWARKRKIRWKTPPKEKESQGKPF